MKRTWAFLALLFLLAGLVPAALAQGPVGQPSTPNVSTGTAEGVTSVVAPEALWPGPDGYGYMGETIPYNWVDISSSGTQIPISGDDMCSGVLNIGFTFPFYGTNWTQFYAQTNGTMQFGGCQAAYSNQCPLPNSTTPENIIALVWDDLYMDADARAWYQTFATCPTGPATQCLVVEFYNMDTLGGQTAGTWEAILYPSGEIRVQFDEVGTAGGASSTTGIEDANAAADYGLTYRCNQAGSLTPDTAIRYFVPPLAISPVYQYIEGCACEDQMHVLKAKNNDVVAVTLLITYTLEGLGTGGGPTTVGPIPPGGTADIPVNLRLSACSVQSDVITMTLDILAQPTGVTATATLVKHNGGPVMAFWQKIADEPNNGRMDNVVAGYNHYVWSVTGYGANTQVRRYDPSNNTWTVLTPGGTVPPVNYARSGCTHGNTVYVYGDAAGSFTGLRAYNMDANTWASLTPGGTPPAQTGIWAPAWVHDDETGYCYLTGGATAPGTGNLSTVYVYDPTANAWLTALPNFTTVRDFHAAFIFRRPSDGHKLLCVAGGNSANVGIASTQCYDFDAGAWNAENADMGALPGDWWGMGYAQKVHGGTDPQLWMVGGVFTGAITNMTRYYDVNTGTYVDGGNLPSGAVYRTSATTLNNEIYKLGGSSGGFTYQGWADHHFQIFCPPCDLTLDTAKHAPPTAEPGQVISYTLVLTPSALELGLFAFDPLPAGVAYAGNLTYTAGYAWYEAADNTVYWIPAPPPPKRTVTVAPPPAGPLPDNALDIASSSEAPGPAPSGLAGPLYVRPEAVLWDNGPLVTHPGACGGQDASRLQTSLSMNTLGFGHQFTLGYRMSDQFTVTNPLGWDIDTITFFAYQTYAPTSPSPITGVYLQIWNGPPWVVGSSVIWGDLVTNRLLSSTFTNIQRDAESSPCANNRYIFADVADVGVHLDPGTYWLDWMTDGNPSYSGPWAPPITILGQTTTGDAYQYTTAWNPALDSGTGTQQGMPFIIEGEAPQLTAYITFDVTVTGECGELIWNEGALVCGIYDDVFGAGTEVWGDPDIGVDPTALWAYLCPDSTDVMTLTICNTGICPLDWEIHEMTPTLVGSMPFVPVEVAGQGINPGLTTASPAPERLAQPPAPARPETVLWDQPLSTVDQSTYVDQEFPDFPDFSSFLADDFVNTDPWDISTIFVPGNGWNGFTTLLNADSLTWQIYADDGTGYPDGDPSGGGNPPVWTLTLPPTDPQVVITNGTGGMPSNTTLNLATPLNLPPGHWWLVFYPTMEFGLGGQYGRQPSDTTNGYVGKFINPGGGFGLGTEWQDWYIIGPTQQDIAFRLEGEVAIVYPDFPWLSEDPVSGTVPVDECTDVAVTFDSTGMPFGDHRADLLILSNDPDEPQVTVPVTMTVLEPATIVDVAYTVTELEVAFDATVTGAEPIAYLWDFGDGITDTVEDPIHTYAEAGCYTVTLDVANACGTDSWTEEICVCDLVDLSEVVVDINGCVVDFTPVYTGSEPFTWLWDFGDGITDTVEAPTHIYAPPGGTFTVTVEVWNCEPNGYDTLTFPVVVSCSVNQPDITVDPLLISATLNPDQTAHRTVTIGNVGTADLDWDLAEAPDAPWLAEAPTSGTVAPAGSTEVDVTFDSTGLAAGTYLTTLEISSNDPDEPVVVVDVELYVVTECLPITGPDFSWWPTTPDAGATVYFTATVTGGSVPITYTWDFGDTGTGSGATVTHVFAAGTYTVTLTVENACTAPLSVEHTVTVLPVVVEYKIYLPLIPKSFAP